MRSGILLCVTALAWGQSPQVSALERQRASIETQRSQLAAQQVNLTLQRESVRRQVPEAATAANAFFSANWASESMIGAADPAQFTCDPLAKDKADAMISANAEKNGLTPDVLRALIRQESSFYPCAVSQKGAMGLMQLMPGTAAQLNVMDPFDPADNVRAGSQYLRQLLDRYDGDLVLALSAYNAGPARVDAAGGIPAIKETREYVQKILGQKQ